MRVLVLSGSPKNDDSITLQSMYFFEKLYVDDEFDIKIVGTGKFKDEYVREFVTTPIEDVKAKHNHHRVILLDETGEDKKKWKLFKKK